MFLYFNGKKNNPNNFQQVLPGKKMKVLTKAALAKRALKKNIQVNTKVMFDEEGEVSRLF